MWYVGEVKLWSEANNGYNVLYDDFPGEEHHILGHPQEVWELEELGACAHLLTCLLTCLRS